MSRALVQTGSTYFFRYVWGSPYQVDHWKTGTWRKLFCGIRMRRDFQYLGPDIDVGYCLDRCNTLGELKNDA